MDLPEMGVLAYPEFGGSSGAGSSLNLEGRPAERRAPRSGP